MDAPSPTFTPALMTFQRGLRKLMEMWNFEWSSEFQLNQSLDSVLVSAKCQDCVRIPVWMWNCAAAGAGDPFQMFLLLSRGSCSPSSGSIPALAGIALNADPLKASALERGVHFEPDRVGAELRSGFEVSLRSSG